MIDPDASLAAHANCDASVNPDLWSSDALIACSCERLRNLIHRMLHRQFPRLRRWEETDDILQQSILRLHRSLRKIQPRSAREFYGLAARQIRWELVDHCRHYFGPLGLAANYESDYDRGADHAAERRYAVGADEGACSSLLAWAEFHECVGKLPEEEREVFDLLWYQQLSQADVASLLGISIRTVKRRWQQAKLRLHESFGDEPPG